MSFDELVENLIFSATTAPSTARQSSVIDAYVEAKLRLETRYGKEGLRAALAYMRFRVVSERLRRTTEEFAPGMMITASWTDR